MWPLDLVQQYERLRAQVVADEGERVVRDRTVSAEILISQGLIGWATRWSGGGPACEGSHRGAETTPVSGADVTVSCNRNAEITRILVNMTVPHMIPTQMPGKEAQR